MATMAKAPKKLRRPGGVELTEEQKQVIWNTLERIPDRQVQTIGGYAGTGKTTTLATLSANLPNYCVCAFTGKAASILRRKGMDASTIHSTIYEVEELPGGRRVFRKKPDTGFAGFLIDEASMVDSGMFQDLLSYGRPIIAIGDHGQLPPVGADAGLMKKPDQVLETIHRNAGAIARFAEYVRKGGQPAGYGDSTETVKILARGSKLDPDSAVKFDQIICAYNKDRVRLNRRIIELLKRDEKPHAGHRVMCLRNSRKFGVFNGQQGIIKKMLGHNVFLFQPDYGEACYVEYHPDGWLAEKAPEYSRHDQRVPFDFAYAITAHKAQGDGWDTVFVIEQKCDLWEHSRWAYTVASRAVRQLTWLPC